MREQAHKVKVGVKENAKDNGLDSSVKVRPRTDTNFGKGILDQCDQTKTQLLLYLGGSWKNYLRV